MTLSEVLAGIPVRSELPPELAHTEVKGLEYDSRRVLPGYLFFAFPGARVDGREFADDALSRGALAVVSEASVPGWIQVEHGRHALVAKRLPQSGLHRFSQTRQLET